MDLSTTYLGLKLRTPLVCSASPLSDTLDGLRRMEDAGASAVVLSSLFEEQLRQDREELIARLTDHTDSFSEAQSFFPAASGFSWGPEAYPTRSSSTSTSSRRTPRSRARRSSAPTWISSRPSRRRRSFGWR